MDKRAMLVQKIENEFDNYIENLKQSSFDVILENTELTANMRFAKEYISKGYVLKDENVDYFLNMEKPLEVICNEYSPNDMEALDDLQTVINRIQSEKLFAAEPPEYMKKLTKKILSGMANVADFISPQGEIKDAELMSFISEISRVLTEEDARFLMQFKKPLDVMNDLVPTAESEKKYIDAALEKMRNSDIYTMPYSLDSDNVLPEAKFRHNAINNINNIVSMPDFNTTANWLKLCRDIYLEDAESSEINPYSSLVDAMYCVSEQHGSEILQKLYDMGAEKCITPMELNGAAAYLANGGNIKRIPTLAQEGYFEEMKPNSTEPEDEEFEM